MTPRYSVVVPVYNEGPNVPALCAGLLTAPPGGEFLLVYDHEEDDTIPAVRALDESRKPGGLRLARNSGRGARDAIVSGMAAANAPVVVVVMADLSDDLRPLEEMVRRVEDGADVVCGSRYVRGGRQIGGPLLKKLLSRAAGISLHLLAGVPVHDPTNSFKAYSKAFLDRTTIESSAGFALGIELTVKAHFSGGRVEEVAAEWRDRSAGTSRFRLFAWMPQYLRWYFWALKRRWLAR